MTRIRMSDYEPQDYTATGRGYLGWGTKDETCRTGEFYSEHGFVRVFESWHPRWQVTMMDFIYQGRHYSRRWKTTWGDRTISRLAREFAEDVAAGQS